MESNSRPGLGLRTVLEGKFHLAGSIKFEFPAKTPGTPMGGAVGFSGEKLSGVVVESSRFSTSSLKVILLFLTATLLAEAAALNLENDSFTCVHWESLSVCVCVLIYFCEKNTKLKRNNPSFSSHLAT